MFDRCKKFGALLLITAVLAPTAFLLAPQKAEAQAGLIGCFSSAWGSELFSEVSDIVSGVGLFVPVQDMGNLGANTATSQSSAALTVKECVLDALVWVAKEVIIAQITASILEWIQSGFQGAPTFITDPGNFFQGLADNAAGLFLTGSDFAFLCEPFQGDLQFNIALNFTSRFPDLIQCRLSEVVSNIQAFVDGFEVTFDVNGNSVVRRDVYTRYGGWDEVGMYYRTNNHPWGATLLAEEEMWGRLTRRQMLTMFEVNVGDGFASIGTCLLRDQDGNCLRSEIQLPGKFVEEYVTKHIGFAGIERLGLADEIDEIVGVLLQQLITMVIQEGVGILNAAGTRDTADPGNFSNQLRASTAELQRQADLENQVNDPNAGPGVIQPPPASGGTAGGGTTGGGTTSAPPPPPPPPPPPSATAPPPTPAATPGAAPNINFVATPESIASGDASTLGWAASTDATTCSGTGFSTGNAIRGTVSVSPTQTTTYDILCQNGNGQTTESVTVTVTAGGTTGGGTTGGGTTSSPPPPPPPPPPIQ